MYFETETFSRDTVSFCYKSGYTGIFLPIRAHKVRVRSINISQTSVSHSVHRGGGVCPGGCVSQHALGQTPSPLGGHCCGRYASYWNAFFFVIAFNHEDRFHHWGLLIPNVFF